MAHRHDPTSVRDRLLARREELCGFVSDNLAELSHRQDAGDEADTAAENIAVETSSRLADLENRELHQIDRALARLAAGGYGSCESCGEPIPAARLKALPFTTSCVRCQERAERRHRERGGRENWELAVDTEDHARSVATAD